MLIEGAWTYRCHAAVGKAHMTRLQGLPQDIRDIAWKAQIRLCARYRRLSARGKPASHARLHHENSGVRAGAGPSHRAKILTNEHERNRRMARAMVP